jgi:hypothetical protein
VLCGSASNAPRCPMLVGRVSIVSTSFMLLVSRRPYHRWYLLDLDRLVVGGDETGDAALGRSGGAATGGQCLSRQDGALLGYRAQTGPHGCPRGQSDDLS